MSSTLTIEYRGLISNLKQVKRIRHMVDALASRADEGRGKTAKSLGELSSKLSRGFPNGATHSGKT
jgi:hypothetical protein